jgi:hypothetical protein
MVSKAATIDSSSKAVWRRRSSRCNNKKCITWTAAKTASASLPEINDTKVVNEGRITSKAGRGIGTNTTEGVLFVLGVVGGVDKAFHKALVNSRCSSNEEEEDPLLLLPNR